MDEQTQARLSVGGNNPPLAQSIAAESGDFALVVTAYLQEAYAPHWGIVDALLEEARALPNPIVDDVDKGKYTSLIKRIRDEAKALDAIHDKEKTPYLRGGQAVDQALYGLHDRLLRRDKKAKVGAGDVLGNRLTEYDNAVLAAEQAERDRQARETARIAREAQEKAAREAAEAEAARLAAERARKPETVQAKADVAVQKEDIAAVSAASAQAATQRAEDAHIATLAKPADLMRQRGADGTLSTMAQEPYAEIEDESLLDMKALWPFIKLEAKEQALRSWAKTTGHTKQMPGAKIGRRAKSVVR